MKTEEQQGWHARSLAAADGASEFGLVAPQGTTNVRKEALPPDLPDLVHQADLLEQQAERAASTGALAKENEDASIPGVGPLTASAAFAPGAPRGATSRPGLTPREDSTGSKARLGNRPA